MALVHDPTADAWTYLKSEIAEGRIEQLGVNFAAPGDRKSKRQTLWLEYPAVGGPSPTLAIKTSPAEPETFHLHPTQINADDHAWVGASGLVGVESVEIPVVNFRPAWQYSSRAKGMLTAPESGEFTFHARAIDGIRFWLDGKLLIDTWQRPRTLRYTMPYTPYIPGGLGYTTATAKLEKGKKYPLTVEFYHQGEKSEFFLLWSTANISKQRIPGEALTTTSGESGVEVTWFEEPDLSGRSVEEVSLSLGGRWNDTLPGPLASLPAKPEYTTQRPYRVTLYFAEPQHVEAGKRTFDVRVQDQAVLENFDIFQTAGQPRTLVKQVISGVLASDAIRITLTPRQGQTLLCGVEVEQEEPAGKKP